MTAVAKVIEIVGSSDKSFEDAIAAGVAEAARTIRGIHGVEIQNMTGDVEGGKIVRYKATLHIAFGVEH